MLVVILANGETLLKIADFDTSRALEQDATAVETSNTGKLNMIYI